jgi:hypothetical protein
MEQLGSCVYERKLAEGADLWVQSELKITGASYNGCCRVIVCVPAQPWVTPRMSSRLPRRSVHRPVPLALIRCYSSSATAKSSSATLGRSFR